jgi:hypothetical protein
LQLVSQLEDTLKERNFVKVSRSDAKSWRKGDRRRETASGNAVGVGKKSCERPKAKFGQQVTCHVDDAEMRHASERAVEENQSSVTDERSRSWGKAAAPNEVIFLSSSSLSPSSIVKFDVTQTFQKMKISSRQKFERRRLQQWSVELRERVSMLLLLWSSEVNVANERW